MFHLVSDLPLSRDPAGDSPLPSVADRGRVVRLNRLFFGSYPNGAIKYFIDALLLQHRLDR